MRASLSVALRRALAAGLLAVGAAAPACGQRVSLGGNEPDPPPTPSCLGQPCGAPCTLSLCDPGPNPGQPCGAPDGAGHCDLSGQCGPAFPVCNVGCANRACGEPCSLCGNGNEPCEICAPGDPDCPMTPPAACNDAGECVAGPPPPCVCTPETCAPSDPCQSSLCGAPCDPCHGDPMCDPGSGPFACDDAGVCAAAFGLTCPADFNPCAAKLCGEPCSICDPGYPCSPPQEVHSCDMGGVCVPGVVPCNG